MKAPRGQFGPHPRPVKLSGTHPAIPVGGIFPPSPVLFFGEYANGVPYLYRRRANNLQDFCPATKLGNQDTTLTPTNSLGYSLPTIVLPPTLTISQSLNSSPMASTS
jgi:hypothetical protein